MPTDKLVTAETLAAALDLAAIPPDPRLDALLAACAGDAKVVLAYLERNGVTLARLEAARQGDSTTGGAGPSVGSGGR